jgi:hypothetical protein
MAEDVLDAEGRRLGRRSVSLRNPDEERAMV